MSIMLQFGHNVGSLPGFSPLSIVASTGLEALFATSFRTCDKFKPSSCLSNHTVQLSECRHLAFSMAANLVENLSRSGGLIPNVLEHMEFARRPLWVGEVTKSNQLTNPSSALEKLSKYNGSLSNLGEGM